MLWGEEGNMFLMATQLQHSYEIKTLPSRRLRWIPLADHLLLLVSAPQLANRGTRLPAHVVESTTV